MDIPVDYADGLAGFGTGIEFLARNGFLDADTDEVLRDLDALVRNIIQQGLRRSEIVGYGKYLVARLAGRTVTDESYVKNKKLLEDIFPRLNASPGSYSETMGAIELLADLYAVWNKPDEITTCIDRLIGGLEDSVRDDVRFGCYPGTFNPLVVAFVLLKVSEKTSLTTCRDKALSLLNEYGKDFVKYLGNDSSGLVSGSFKWAVLYRYIGKQLSDKGYDRLVNGWLKRCLEKKELLTDGCAGIPVGTLDGYAGIGLSLLDAAGGISEEWTDIIPLYYERGKVTFTR